MRICDCDRSTWSFQKKKTKPAQFVFLFFAFLGKWSIRAELSLSRVKIRTGTRTVRLVEGDDRGAEGGGAAAEAEVEKN